MSFWRSFCACVTITIDTVLHLSILAKFQQGNGQKNASIAKSSSQTTTRKTETNGNTSAQSSADIWAMLKKASEQGSVDVPADLNIALAKNEPRQLLHKPSNSDKQKQVPDNSRSIVQQQQQLQQRPYEEQLAFGQLMEQMKKSASIAPQMPAAPVAPVEQYQQIKLEDMFRVDARNLPKPPMNWRNQQPIEPESNDGAPTMPQQLASQHQPMAPQMHPMPAYRSFAPSFGIPPPPFNPRPIFPPPSQQQQHQQQHHIPRPLHPQLHPMQQQQLHASLQSHQNYMPFTMHQVTPFFQQPHGQQTHAQHHQQPQHQHQQQQNQQLQRQGPQGPQNLRQNGVYPSAQGAFIPLQATRKQAAATAAAAASNKNSPVVVGNKKKDIQILRRNEEASNRTSQSAATETPSSSKTDQVTSIAKSPSSESTGPNAKPARFIVPAPKPSRIAARFDMNP